MLERPHVTVAHNCVTHVAGIFVRAVVSAVEAGRSELVVVSGQLNSKGGVDYVGLVVKGSNVQVDWRRETGEELRRRRNSRRSSNCWRRWRNRRKPLSCLFSSVGRLARQDIARFPWTRDIHRDVVLRLEAAFETQYEARTCMGGEDDHLGHESRRFGYRLRRMVYTENLY